MKMGGCGAGDGSLSRLVSCPGSVVEPPIFGEGDLGLFTGTELMSRYHGY